MKLIFVLLLVGGCQHRAQFEEIDDRLWRLERRAKNCMCQRVKRNKYIRPYQAPPSVELDLLDRRRKRR